MNQRERLLQFQRKADEVAANKKREELEAKHKTRASMMARYLIIRTTDRLPEMHNGMTIYPCSSRRTREVFRNSLVLGDDFQVDNLELVADGDRVSKWFNYRLFYRIPDSSDPPEVVTGFSATEHAYGESNYSAETKLGIHDQDTNKTLPVEFDSSDYHFIRSVAGLFLPKVVRDLEEVGL